jgi:predicted nucleic acid-binding protein
MVPETLAMKFMLDTNVFNRLLDRKLQLWAPADSCTFVATPVQIREIEATPDGQRRADLLAMFEAVSPVVEATALAFDVGGAGSDEGTWSDEIRIEALLQELDGRRKKSNNLQDALIAAVVMSAGYVLMTADRDLADVAEKFGIVVHRLA